MLKGVKVEKVDGKVDLIFLLLKVEQKLYDDNGDKRILFCSVV